MKYNVIRYSYREFRWVDEIVLDADSYQEAIGKAKELIPPTPTDEITKKQSVDGAHWGAFKVPAIKEIK